MNRYPGQQPYKNPRLQPDQPVPSGAPNSNWNHSFPRAANQGFHQNNYYSGNPRYQNNNYNQRPLMHQNGFQTGNVNRFHTQPRPYNHANAAQSSNLGSQNNPNPWNIGDIFQQSKNGRVISAEHSKSAQNLQNQSATVQQAAIPTRSNNITHDATRQNTWGNSAKPMQKQVNPQSAKSNTSVSNASSARPTTPVHNNFKPNDMRVKTPIRPNQTKNTVNTLYTGPAMITPPPMVENAKGSKTPIRQQKATTPLLTYEAWAAEKSSAETQQTRGRGRSSGTVKVTTPSRNVPVRQTKATTPVRAVNEAANEKPKRGRPPGSTNREKTMAVNMDNLLSIDDFDIGSEASSIRQTSRATTPKNTRATTPKNNRVTTPKSTRATTPRAMTPQRNKTMTPKNTQATTPRGRNRSTTPANTGHNRITTPSRSTDQIINEVVETIHRERTPARSRRSTPVRNNEDQASTSSTYNPRKRPADRDYSPEAKRNAPLVLNAITFENYQKEVKKMRNAVKSMHSFLGDMQTAMQAIEDFVPIMAKHCLDKPKTPARR